MDRRTFNRNIAVAGAAAALSPFGIVRAQAQKLRVGVLLPRSGVQPASARTAIARSTSPPASCASSACRPSTS